MKKEKMNDKGFSLVELIIVIAIMAVLVVVLAPQYLKYVERSRNSTDLQNATAIVTASDKTFKTGTFEITVTDSNASVTNQNPAQNKDAAEAAVADASITLSDVKCKSKTKWTQYVITGTVNADGGITFTYSDANFANAMAGE